MSPVKEIFDRRHEEDAESAHAFLAWAISVWGPGDPWNKEALGEPVHHDSRPSGETRNP